MSKMRGLKDKALFVGVLISLLILAIGCADQAKKVDEASPPVTTQQDSLKGVSLTYLTLGPGTSFYNLGVALSSVIEKHTPMLLTPQVVPGALAIQEGLKEKKGDLAPLVAVDWYFAYHGLPPFEGKEQEYSFVRVLQSGYANYIGIVTAQDSGIKSFADLKGKRVVWETTGSPFGTLFAKAVLEANGLDPYKDVKSVKAVHVTDAYKELVEGRADAAVYTHLPALVEENAQRFSPVFIPMDRQTYDYVSKQITGLSLVEFPYELHTLKPGVPVAEFYVALFAHKDLPEEIAYTIVRTVIETYDQEFANKDAYIRQFSPQHAVRKLGLPYHSGAIKYYKEAGLWSQEMDEYQETLLKGRL